MMQIFAWYSEVNASYGLGRIAAVAPDVETARAAILADFDRWVRSEDESPPYVTGCFDATTEDGYAAWMSEWEREEMEEELAAHRKQLQADLSADPIPLPGGILYVRGSE